MTVTLDQKIQAVDRLLDDLRWARNDPAVPEHITYKALTAIAVDLRAQTPKEAGKVLRSMTHQVDTARHTKARLGYFEHGQLQTITEATCGRWWPTVRRALELYESELQEQGTA